MTDKKRIGILTSGGDCAGLNAAIRAVVHRSHILGWETIGLINGTASLLEADPEFKVLHPNDCSAGVLRAGGTILGTTNKGNPFAFPMPDGSLKDRSDEIVQGFKKLGLDAVIGIGGFMQINVHQRLDIIVSQKGHDGLGFFRVSSPGE